MGAQMQRRAYSRVCGASTAFRPVAVGVGGAERGAPMSQSACSRVRGASTAKGAAQRGCSATGPTPRATGSPAALGYAGRTSLLFILVGVRLLHGLLLLHRVVQQGADEHGGHIPHGQATSGRHRDLAFLDHFLQPLLLILADLELDLDQLFFSSEWIHSAC